MANNTFPEDWRDQPCFLVSIPRPLVPYVGGLMKIAENRGFWASDIDFSRGYTAVIELEGCLMSTCLDVLLQQNDALYRMLNTALLGVAYTTVSEDPLVVTPAIAPHVNLDIHDQDSLMGRLDRLTQLIDNRIAGTETPLYDALPGVKQQLEAMTEAEKAREQLDGKRQKIQAAIDAIKSKEILSVEEEGSLTSLENSLENVTEKLARL